MNVPAAPPLHPIHLRTPSPASARTSTALGILAALLNSDEKPRPTT